MPSLPYQDLVPSLQTFLLIEGRSFSSFVGCPLGTLTWTGSPCFEGLEGRTYLAFAFEDLEHFAKMLCFEMIGMLGMREIGRAHV